MTQENFEGINARETALIEADHWQDVEEDLKDPEVQKAWGLLPGQIAAGREDYEMLNFEAKVEVIRDYDERPTLTGWCQLPRRERMRRLADIG